jgi:hypothetical protein
MGIQAESGCLWVRNTYNYTKDEIVALVQQYVDGTTVEHKDLTICDICVICVYRSLKYEGY